MVDGKGLLDALLGAAASNQGASSQGKHGADTGGLGDILGQVFGNRSSSQAGTQGGGLGDLLGQVLGGGSQSQAGGQGGGLGSILGQVFGGGSKPQAGSHAGGGLGDIAGQVFGGAAGASGGLVDAVKNAVARNPGLAQTAVIGMAGLLLGSSKARGLAMSAAKLGGIALIGTLGYQAIKNYQNKAAAPDAPEAATLPEPHEYTPVATSSDGALLLVRAMIAAAMADGNLDAVEQQRITGRMSNAALSEDQAAWLQKELSKPATVEELASSVSLQQEAVEVYVAARIAIDPDTAPNKAFLQNLATALTLPAGLVAELDKTVDSVKVDAAA